MQLRRERARRSGLDATLAHLPDDVGSSEPTSAATRLNAARSIWRSPGNTVSLVDGSIGTQSSGSKQFQMKPRASGASAS